VGARFFEPSRFNVVGGGGEGRGTGKNAVFLRRERVQNLRNVVVFGVLEDVDERFARSDVGDSRGKEENRFADLDLIAVEETTRFDPTPVNVNAVRTFEVDQRSTVDVESYFGVSARNFGVAQSNVVRRVASDRRRFVVERETVPLVVALNDKKRVKRPLRSDFFFARKPNGFGRNAKVAGERVDETRLLLF
jgi:hypothetical protein